MRRLPDTATLALDFDRKVDPAPVATPADVERVIAILSEATAWMTAAEIAEALGDKYTDRKVRRVASAAAPQIVSFPGSPGYRLFNSCTVEEIDHCIATFRSQARDMTARSILYERAYHHRQRGPSS